MISMKYQTLQSVIVLTCWNRGLANLCKANAWQFGKRPAPDKTWGRQLVGRRSELSVKFNLKSLFLSTFNAIDVD